MRIRSLGFTFLLVSLSFACGGVDDTEPAPPVGEPAPPSAPPPAATATPDTPPTPPSPTCKPREEEDAREGTPALAPLDVEPCTFKDYDEVGAVLSVVRTFDAGQRVLTETLDRLDEPPRSTDHDQIFGI